MNYLQLKLAQMRARGHEGEQVPTPVGEQRADGAGYDSEQDAFREQLANEPPAVRANGRANSHLPLTYDGAREHEVGDVGAGDEEYQTHHDHEDGADPGHKFPASRSRPPLLPSPTQHLP